MKLKSLARFGLALALTLGLTTPAPAAVSLSLGAEYASGNYETDATVRSVYLPLIVTWLPDARWDVSLEIPYLFQSSSNLTTHLYSNGVGMVAQQPAYQGGGNGRSRLAATDGGPEAEVAASSTPAKSDVSGLGDVILRVGVIALAEGVYVPQLRPSLFVKFPTASRDDGLGTGEYDGGLGCQAVKWFDNLQLAGEAFHVWQGEAEGFGLRNYWSYTAQAGYLLTETVEPLLVVKGATAPAEGSGQLLEGRVRLLWALSEATVLDLYVARGLTDNSPDYGGGMTLVYSF